MPPRYAYWTIIVDEQPTAFRAAQQEDLMPTFKRLMEKHPSAKLVWFQNGKIWASRLDAQEAMRERGERGRIGDKRQGGWSGEARSARVGGFRDRKRERNVGETFRSPEPARQPGDKLDWKPKGEFTPAPKRERSDRPEWKPKGSATGARAPRRSGTREGGSFNRDRKPEWKPRGRNGGEQFSAPAGDRAPRRERAEKLEWKPRGENQVPGRRPPASARTEADKQAPGARRKWIPKEEYKKSRGIEAPRDSKWRPGGDHRDPKQKYKDAKKAKWSRFKQTIRKRWESKQGQPPGKKQPKKRNDEE